MGDPNGRREPLNSARHQFQVGIVTQTEVIEPLGLGPAHVTGSGIALRINICVVLDEGIPVLIPCPFDRLSNLLAVERRGVSLLLAPRSGWLVPRLPATPSPWRRYQPGASGPGEH
jgi:hypothetical protein